MDERVLHTTLGSDLLSPVDGSSVQTTLSVSFYILA